MSVQMARWRDTSVILVAMMVAIPAIALGFTAGPTDGVISPTWQYTFCMDDVPSGFAVSQTQAEASLSQVVSAWENTAGVRTGQAISIAIDNQFACTSPQSSADAYVTFVAGGALAEATILGSYTVIRFNQEEDWVWEGPATGKYSFAGVLGHEMGHALSLAHAGTGIWGSDGDLPSMTGGFELGDGAFGQTTERDDRGGPFSFGAMERLVMTSGMSTRDSKAAPKAGRARASVCSPGSPTRRTAPSEVD